MHLQIRCRQIHLGQILVTTNDSFAVYNIEENEKEEKKEAEEEVAAISIKVRT